MCGLLKAWPLTGIRHMTQACSRKGLNQPLPGRHLQAWGTARKAGGCPRSAALNLCPKYGCFCKWEVLLSCPIIKALFCLGSIRGAGFVKLSFGSIIGQDRNWEIRALFRTSQVHPKVLKSIRAGVPWLFSILVVYWGLDCQCKVCFAFARFRADRAQSELSEFTTPSSLVQPSVPNIGALDLQKAASSSAARQSRQRKARRTR